MRVSVQDYTVYNSSLQDLSLLTLCRRSAGEAGSDFTWADLSKAQWGLD